MYCVGEGVDLGVERAGLQADCAGEGLQRLDVRLPGRDEFLVPDQKDAIVVQRQHVA